MSDVIKYDTMIQANCTVEGTSTVNQKGGYLRVNIKIPITAGDPAGAEHLAGKLTTHLGNVARLTLEFSSMKAGQRGGDGEEGEDPAQMTLDELED